MVIILVFFYDYECLCCVSCVNCVGMIYVYIGVIVWELLVFDVFVIGYCYLLVEVNCCIWRYVDGIGYCIYIDIIGNGSVDVCKFVDKIIWFG